MGELTNWDMRYFNSELCSNDLISISIRTYNFHVLNNCIRFLTQSCIRTKQHSSGKAMLIRLILSLYYFSVTTKTLYGSYNLIAESLFPSYLFKMEVFDSYGEKLTSHNFHLNRPWVERA